MNLKGKRIGFGFTGSHCTYEEVMPHLEKLVAEGSRSKTGCFLYCAIN